jgi:hypothetical protein
VDRRTAATGTFQWTEATSNPSEGAQRLSGRCILDDLHREFLFCINCSLKYPDKDLHLDLYKIVYHDFRKGDSIFLSRALSGWGNVLANPSCRLMNFTGEHKKRENCFHVSEPCSFAGSK